jgi:hypothetical protein
LQHPIETGTHFQLVTLLLGQVEECSRLIHRRLLDGELRTARLGFTRKLFLRDLIADTELVALDLRLLEDQCRDELILGELLVHLCLHLRFVEVRFHLGGRRARLQELVVQRHFRVRQARFRRLQLERRVLQLLFKLRVGQL